MIKEFNGFLSFLVSIFARIVTDLVDTLSR
jgi:hypothetical protein